MALFVEFEAACTLAGMHIVCKPHKAWLHVYNKNNYGDDEVRRKALEIAKALASVPRPTNPMR